MPMQSPAQPDPRPVHKPALWEGTALEIAECTEHALRQRLGDRPDLGELARHVVVGILDTIGGQVCYLPRGESIRRAMRNEAIYQEWKAGMKPAELARKYRISSQQIYEVLAKRRAAPREQRAPRQKLH